MNKFARNAADTLSSAPFAVGAVLVMWMVAFATHSVMHGPGQNLLLRADLGIPALFGGSWYPVSSRLWCADLAGYLGTTAMLVVICIPIERRIGSARTATAFILTLLIGSLIFAAFAAVPSVLHWSWLRHIGTESAVGPGSGAIGLALAFSAWLNQVWRRRVRVTLIVTLLTFAFYSAQHQDLRRLIVGLSGLAIGPLLMRRSVDPTSPPGVSPMSSTHEARLLVALVIAAMSLGPFVSTLYGSLSGPAALIRQFWISPHPVSAVLRSKCVQGATGNICHPTLVHIPASGVASDLRMILPILVSLVFAEGIRRGRRIAYYGTIVFQLTLAALGVVVLSKLTHGFTATPVTVRTFGSIGWIQSAAIIAEPLAVVSIAFKFRSHFNIQAPREAVHHFLIVTGSALVVVSALYVIGGYFARSQFDRILGFRSLFSNLPLRFLPPTYLGLVHPRALPKGTLTRMLSEWTGVGFWAVVFSGSILLFWKTRSAELPSDPDGIRGLLEQHGGSNFSYMATWKGHSHWFSTDRRCAIAYRVVAGVAITTGDPIGDPHSCAEAIRDFSTHCNERGWTTCFYSITDGGADVLDGMGWHLLHVGEDALVSLDSLEFRGKQWQDVRSAFNRAKRLEISCQWCTYPTASEELKLQIREVSNQWLNNQSTPEMGFTIGSLADLDDGNVRCQVAVDKSGSVQGIVSWMPVMQDGSIKGWTLDFMRRRSDAMAGIMDLLIGSSLADFKHAGARFASLSAVPLVCISSTNYPNSMTQPLELIRNAINPLYDFRSLLAYKSKFGPTYHPLFLGYQDPTALPMIAYAIGRAYVGEMTLREVVGIGVRSAIEKAHVRKVSRLAPLTATA